MSEVAHIEDWVEMKFLNQSFVNISTQASVEDAR